MSAPERGAARARPLRLLGIDPGTRLAGWGVVEMRGSRLVLVACGVLRPTRRVALAERLAQLFAGYEGVLRKYRPRMAALEETFAGRNLRSAIALGEGRGVALLALARAGLEVAEFAPARIKLAVTGRGNASKLLVAKLVCARLGLARPPRPADITDALAAAITLAQRR